MSKPPLWLKRLAATQMQCKVSLCHSTKNILRAVLTIDQYGSGTLMVEVVYAFWLSIRVKWAGCASMVMESNLSAVHTIKLWKYGTLKTGNIYRHLKDILVKLVVYVYHQMASLLRAAILICSGLLKYGITPQLWLIISYMKDTQLQLTIYVLAQMANLY